MAEFPYHVFLSYNSAQKDWTLDLARRLRDSGFNVWFDEWRLRGGESWIDGLERGIQESEHLVFVVSPESAEAQWPNFEQLIAILEDPDARFRKVIPIIHTPHPLRPRMRIRQHIDFSDTHDNPFLYEFRLAQLMADLDPSRERPEDFERWREQVEAEEPGEIPPVGPLPRGSVMPHRPNPHFVGREEELPKLESLLRAGSTTAIGQVAAATGLGGIGKTQLAVEYAYRYGRRYAGGVFWLDMEDPEGIGSQVAQCGGKMNLPGFDQLSQPEQIEHVKEEWNGPTLRLLIFDNVAESEVVGEWRPRPGGCRVLITSRKMDWPDGLGLEEVRLATLPRPKAVELLCKGRPEALEDEGERKAADAICETLGDLPLAVALAGRYLESYKYDVTLGQYLQGLQAQPVLDNPALVDFVKDPSPTDHVQNVAATFNMSYERLDGENETDLLAMRLFHLASHFAPVSINRRLLAKAAGLSPEEEEGRRQATEGIRRLTGLGLMEEEAEGRLLLHRLLGDFARAHPAPRESEEEGWDAVALTVGAFATEENESGLPAGLARELAHLRHLAVEAERRGWSEAGSLYNELGRHLRIVASYAEAQEYIEQALAMDEAAFGPSHPNVARDRDNLGLVLRWLSDLEGARENHERALAIDEATFGPSHPTVAIRLGNLGITLRQMGDLEGARQRYERALAIDEKAFGPDHPKVAIRLNNLGIVRRRMGDLEGARECYERALAIDEKAFGTDHPKVAIRLNNLGMVLRVTGDLEGAWEHYERALAIDEKAFGPDHPKVAIRLNNLGMVLRMTGDPEGAWDHYERALAIDETVFGPDHPKVAIRLNNLGRVLKAMGSLQGAREHLERALGIDEKALGLEHPQVATAVNNLGLVLRDMGDLAGAREHFERALAIDEKALGPDHPNVARIVWNLGDVLHRTGKLQEARGHYERALAILRRVYGEEHPDTQMVLSNLKALDKR
jgi:tetratricopeptide (TPR) repeat protein